MCEKFNLSLIEKIQDLVTVLRCCKLLQIFTFLNMPTFTLQISIYVFGLNILAFEAFSMSCFGQ